MASKIALLVHYAQRPSTCRMWCWRKASKGEKPFAALIARIRDARSPGRGGGGPSRDPPPADETPRSHLEDYVETYIRTWEVDRQAADALRNCDGFVKEAVLQRGLRGARNPSSALLARIRDVKADSGRRRH